MRRRTRLRRRWWTQLRRRRARQALPALSQPRRRPSPPWRGSAARTWRCMRWWLCATTPRRWAPRWRGWAPRRRPRSPHTCTAACCAMPARAASIAAVLAPLENPRQHRPKLLYELAFTNFCFCWTSQTSAFAISVRPNASVSCLMLISQGHFCGCANVSGYAAAECTHAPGPRAAPRALVALPPLAHVVAWTAALLDAHFVGLAMQPAGRQVGPVPLS